MVERVVDDVLDRGVVLLLRLDHLRPVAAAEDVVLASVTLVEGAGVGPVEVPHSLVEIRGGRLHEEVVVVAHQAIRVKEPGLVGDDRREKVQEKAAVASVPEDRPAFMSTAGDVVQRAGELEAERSRHMHSLL